VKNNDSSSPSTTNGTNKRNKYKMHSTKLKEQAIVMAKAEGVKKAS